MEKSKFSKVKISSPIPVDFNKYDVLDDKTVCIFGAKPYIFELRSIINNTDDDKDLQNHHWAASDTSEW